MHTDGAGELPDFGAVQQVGIITVHLVEQLPHRLLVLRRNALNDIRTENVSLGRYSNRKCRHVSHMIGIMYPRLCMSGITF